MAKVERVARAYVAWLGARRVRAALVLLWAAAAVGGAACLPAFVRATSDTLETAGATPARLAEAAAHARFGAAAAAHDTLVVYGWARGGGAAVGALDAACVADRLAQPALGGNATLVARVDGVTAALGRGWPSEAAWGAFSSAGNRSFVWPVELRRGAAADDVEALAARLAAAMPGIRAACGQRHARLELLGTTAFLRAIQAAVERDMAVGDAVVVPIAFALLAVMVRASRWLVLVFACLAASVMVAFGSMALPALYLLDIMSATLSLMMSLSIALCIDYGLFLGTRLREQLLKGDSLERALVVTLDSAGHTIVVSGLTLFASFAGLLLVPIDTVRGIGLGCAATVLAVLAANLSLLPALLLSFPDFFQAMVSPSALQQQEASVGGAAGDEMATRGATIELGSGDEASVRTPEQLLLTGDVNALLEGSDDGDDVPAPPHGAVQRHRRRTRREARHQPRMRLCGQHTLPLPQCCATGGCCTWVTFAETIVRPPYNILALVGVLALTAPFAYPALTFHTSCTVMEALPQDAAVTDAFRSMTTEFGFGFSDMYSLMIAVPHNANFSVLSAEFFSRSQSAVDELAARLPNTTRSNFVGISSAGGQHVPEFVLEACNVRHWNASVPPALPQCPPLRELFNSSVNADQSAALFRVALSFDPSSAAGKVWYDTARAVMPDVAQNHSVELALYGGPSDSWDGVQAAFDAFPSMIAITSGVILVMVGVALRSVVIPLRSLVAIACTLAFCYGSAALVYEHGVLDWLGFWGLHSFADNRSLLWMPPLVSFGIIVGLALDYDLFLLIRVADYRKKEGFANKESIVRGLVATGPVITSAGVIMAVAFSGLLLSKTPAMNQLSFFLVSAVLYDTFVVRTLIVPSLMSLVGDWSYWPGLRPEHNEILK